VLIISQARHEALLLALAAQWLGGSVTLLDPERDNRALLARLRPRVCCKTWMRCNNSMSARWCCTSTGVA
jgi:hypothetical protein